MEFHYPSAYSTPTTLNNLQINNHEKITSLQNTNDPFHISTNSFHYNLRHVPSSSSSLSELQYNHNIKHYEVQEVEEEDKEEEEEVEVEVGLKDHKVHETMKQFDVFDISPQLNFGESSSSIETFNNLSSYFNPSNEYNTHIDWLSQLSQTTTTTATTTPNCESILTNSSCISPSWKHNEYVHYSYTNCSTDMNISQQQEQQSQQQPPPPPSSSPPPSLSQQQIEYQQIEQKTFQEFHNVQYNQLDEMSYQYPIHNNFYDHIIEPYDTIEMTKNVQSIEKGFNIDPYNTSYDTPIQPIDTTYINNNSNIINNQYNNDNNNNILMKLHQHITPIHHNEQSITYPLTYDDHDPDHDRDHNDHDHDHYNQKLPIDTTSLKSQYYLINKTKNQYFNCQLCSLENSYPLMTKSQLNFNQLNWENNPQTIINNQFNSIYEKNLNNNQYFHEYSTQILNESYFPSYNQYINIYDNHNHEHKRKQYKKHMNSETINYKNRLKSILPQQQQQQRSSSPSSRQQQQQPCKATTTTATKLTKLFHITNEQLSSLLPFITCNEIHEILNQFNPPNTMAQFQTICINNNNKDKNKLINNHIYFQLKEQKIWSDIYLHNTEMIATNTGRRIFPSLSVDVFGLNPNDQYIFLLDMLLIQPHIFKHQGDRWIISSQSEVLNHSHTLEGKYYIQEESPKTGAYWMESGVNFTRVKITNTKEIKPYKNMIHVNSMHYYIPRISVVRLNHLMDNQSNYYHPTSNSSGISNQSNQLELIGSYIIPGTQFYTVTAYQNPDVIRIKINNNPFAKGFRNRQDTDEFNDLAVLSVMNSRNKYMTTTSSSSSSTSLSVSSINFSKKTHINYSNENYQC
ncbi:unnamed protein product [Schistosoma margrebowiei]|uniref:T-box domain-containing protein n=1 Tax=Schistosoma margrebowiei TaxID=48269 RepID=A0AA85ANU0_9TREM|nr:unnamed protein product [Schistosoma margrebowiei]